MRYALAAEYDSTSSGVFANKFQFSLLSHAINNSVRYESLQLKPVSKTNEKLYVIETQVWSLLCMLKWYFLRIALGRERTPSLPPAPPFRPSAYRFRSASRCSS